MTQPESDPITIDDIGNLVRLLAMTVRDDTRPHPAINLVTPSLLQQLRTNIAPDGNTGGRSVAANERLPINAAALSLYDFLNRRIQQQYESGTGRTPKGSPEELLVGWYVGLAIDAAAGELTQELLDALHTRLDDWRTRIMDLFNPPERADVPYACPECGFKIIDRPSPEGVTRQHALVWIERPWKVEEGVRCRCCNTTWIGDGPLTELAADLLIDLKAVRPKPEAAPAAASLRPLYLAAMTRDQANELARINGVDPRKDILLASNGPGPRIRSAERPILLVTHEAYAPGRHEAARVAEAQRTARLVNGMNGYNPDGTPLTDPAAPTDQEITTS